MNDFQIIETDRLCLHQPSQKDIPDIVKYAGNKLIADNTMNIPHPYKKKDAVAWLDMIKKGLKEKKQYTFGINLDNKGFIGAIGLKVNLRYNHAEAGYWIGGPFWGHGYACEALTAILKFGFDELNLHKIFAAHYVNNAASGRVMIKCGMIKEGELVDHYKKGDQYHTLAQYRLTKKEWQEVFI